MITQKDILADLHTHTIFSQHAYSTLKENVNVAKNRGLKYIAITDHYYGSGDDIMRKNETTRIAYMTHDVMQNEKDIVVVGGAEFNLGQEIPYWDKIQHIPWRPIGVHSWFWNRENSTLESVYNAFEIAAKSKRHNAFAHIEREIHKINHSKYGEELSNDVKEFYIQMVHLAKREKVFLEVNESSIITNEKGGIKRLKYWLQLAKEQNCLIYLGTDSHYCENVGVFKYAIELLNEIDYPKELILNCNINELSCQF